MEVSHVTIQGLVLRGVKPCHGPVDGTFVDFTLDDTLSSTMISRHRGKWVASLNCRPNQQKMTRICIPTQGQWGLLSDCTGIPAGAFCPEMFPTVLQACSFWPSEPVSCPHIFASTLPLHFAFFLPSED